jgi:hypothetical protein
MVERLDVETTRVLTSATALRQLCDALHIPVPSLQQVLGTVVAAKLCPDAWDTIACRAYTQSFPMQVRANADRKQLAQLHETPVDALHILAAARLSSQAPNCGQYIRFCRELSLPIDPTSQMLFFTLDQLNDNKHAIWGNQLVGRTLGATHMSTLPQVEIFAQTVSQRQLHESYALLLSGITFDLGRLNPRMLAAADFPCQRPPQEHRTKQQLWAELHQVCNGLKSLRVRAKERNIEPDQLGRIDEVASYTDRTDYTKLPKVQVRSALDEARWAASVLEDNQLSEQEICQQTMQNITRLQTQIAQAKQQIDYNAVKAAGRDAVASWKMPPTRNLDSTRLFQLASEMRMVLRELEHYASTD